MITKSILDAYNAASAFAVGLYETNLSDNMATWSTIALAQPLGAPLAAFAVGVTGGLIHNIGKRKLAL